MITENSGFQYLGFDCGYRWIPSVERGLEKGSSLGTAIAVIMDGQVVTTLGTYPPLWEALRDGVIADITANHSFPETHSVINILTNESIAYTLHISEALLAAAIVSNPLLVEITSDFPHVGAGWSYIDGTFNEPI